MRKQLLLAIAVAGLIALNVWRWLPQAGSASSRNDVRETAPTETFSLKVAGSNVQVTPIRRDLFHHAVRPVVAKTTKAPKEPTTPAKTEVELALEAAQAQFASIRLIGVVLRDGKGQAYLQSGDTSELVQEGDPFGAFVVESIRQDVVELRDPVTQAGGRVSLSGS